MKIYLLNLFFWKKYGYSILIGGFKVVELEGIH